MKKKILVVSFALSAIGALSTPASAAPSCLKNAPGCVNQAVCAVGAALGLQCVD